ncbi:hypothetical protein MTsPCn9_27420 [Croceitalea sp. MTPC9]|uniref:hypothetical protein n=1 Tax=unclassified Croceitalea TaxID=2632280 RepID=UPI002B3B9290|nr:hypothetical protein MTsPCn6_22760 [Croceitalea sp. MTPC6]GMN17804.1 hypothetical protein MTsPCn9_27420 [Croceitalea sp. MTPC9]
MKKILLLLSLFFLAVSAGNAQLNDYKYIIVPKKFDDFKNANQYQTSTLLKYLFVEASYNAIYDDMLPEDLRINGCLGLKADLENKSSLFTTKVNIVVRDCNGLVVFTSKEGRSKKKEYKPAYMEAIKEAFASYNTLNYKYVPKEEMEEKPITISFKNDVKSLDEEVIQKSVDKKTEASTVKQEATLENQSYKSVEPVASTIQKGNKTSEILEEKLEMLYAQPIENGFQLIDNTPKIRYKLIETSVKNVFLATRDNVSGVILSKNGRWFFEYNENGEKVLEELNIKF